MKQNFTIDNNIFKDLNRGLAQDLLKLNTTLDEALEIIYPAYKTFVDKCPNSEYLKKQEETRRQTATNDLLLIKCPNSEYLIKPEGTRRQTATNDVFLIANTYVEIINGKIKKVTDKEISCDCGELTLGYETSLAALLILMGCKTLYPNLDGDADNWKLIEKHLKRKHKDNYEAFIQNVKDNHIQFMKEHAEEIYKRFMVERAMLTKELNQCKKDLNSLPDKIYTEIIQKAQDAINRGDDISAMKVTLFSLLPPTYSETIMLLHRQPNSMVNHFHEGATCNQADTINNHINE